MGNKILIEVSENNYKTTFLRTIYELSIELLGTLYCSGLFQSISYRSEKPINLYYISEGHRYHERDTLDSYTDEYYELKFYSKNSIFKYIMDQIKYLR